MNSTPINTENAANKQQSSEDRNPNPWYTVRGGKIVEINGRLIKAPKKRPVKTLSGFR
jgi:hypothetical protein